MEKILTLELYLHALKEIKSLLGRPEDASNASDDIEVKEWKKEVSSALPYMELVADETEKNIQKI